MDLTAQYCPTRRDLEELSWSLTSRLAGLTGRLLRLVGDNHDAFLVVKGECAETRAALVASHQTLSSHRSDHGC